MALVSEAPSPIPNQVVEYFRGVIYPEINVADDGKIGIPEEFFVKV